MPGRDDGRALTGDDKLYCDDLRGRLSGQNWSFSARNSSAGIAAVERVKKSGIAWITAARFLLAPLAGRGLG